MAVCLDVGILRRGRATHPSAERMHAHQLPNAGRRSRHTLPSSDSITCGMHCDTLGLESSAVGVTGSLGSVIHTQWHRSRHNGRAGWIKTVPWNATVMCLCVCVCVLVPVDAGVEWSEAAVHPTSSMSDSRSLHRCDLNRLASSLASLVYSTSLMYVRVSTKPVATAATPARIVPPITRQARMSLSWRMVTDTIN